MGDPVGRAGDREYRLPDPGNHARHLALEIPLPDADGRRRLLGLYGAGIEIDAGSAGQLVERSDGVSDAFIKELVRQAWLRAALEDREPPTARTCAACSTTCSKSARP